MDEDKKSPEELCDALEAARFKCKRAKEALCRLDFGQPVIRTAQVLVDLDSTELDYGITRFLVAVGAFVGVDRNDFSACSIDGTRTEYLNAWPSCGTIPQTGFMQNTPLSTLHWRPESLQKLKPTCVATVADLPHCASEKRQTLQPQDIRSLITLKMRYARRLIGGVGFDCKEEMANLARNNGQLGSEFLDSGSDYSENALNDSRQRSGMYMVRRPVPSALHGTLAMHKDRSAITTIQVSDDFGEENRMEGIRE